MTQERFTALAEAYGGNIARWPAVEREAAELFLAQAGKLASDALAVASDLDAVLNLNPSAAPEYDLIQRILADAPRPRRVAWRQWLLPTGMGAGLAAACLAGVITGASASRSVAPQDGEAQVTLVTDDVVGFGLDEDA